MELPSSKLGSTSAIRWLIAPSRYYYDGWVHLLADLDGVRLITNDVCEFLQKVPGTYHLVRNLLWFFC